MLKIIFSRRGKRNQPFFRLIVLEKTKDPWGDFLEDLGYYNPLTKKGSFKVERIKHWLSHGAQPSGRIHNLLIDKGVIKGKKVKVTKTKPKKGEKKEVQKEKIDKKEEYTEQITDKKEDGKVAEEKAVKE